MEVVNPQLMMENHEGDGEKEQPEIRVESVDVSRPHIPSFYSQEFC
jgi:hypothetical protein